MKKITLFLITGLLVRCAPEAEEEWQEYGNKQYYIERRRSGDHKMAVEACANLSATLVMLKDKDTRKAVEIMVAYPTPMGAFCNLF